MLYDGFPLIHETANEITPKTPQDIYSVFAMKEKEERTRQHKTQEWLAEAVGVSVDTIKKSIEKGESVKLDVAYNISVALGVPLEALLPMRENSRAGKLKTIRLLLDELENAE